MTLKERQSCISTINLLRRLAFNVHGVIDELMARVDDVINQINAQRDDIKDIKVTVEAPEPKVLKIPNRSLGMHKIAIKEIKEEIEVHKNCIKEEQKLLKEVQELRENNIKNHQEAIVELEKELTQENEFLRVYS